MDQEKKAKRAITISISILLSLVIIENRLWQHFPKKTNPSQQETQQHLMKTNIALARMDGYSLEYQTGGKLKYSYLIQNFINESNTLAELYLNYSKQEKNTTLYDLVNKDKNQIIDNFAKEINLKPYLARGIYYQIAILYESARKDSSTYCVYYDKTYSIYYSLQRNI